MSLLDEAALRALIVDAVREVLREAAPAREERYASVGRAAEIAEVTPATIRRWVDEKRLRRYRAGRELRVKVSELEKLLATGWDQGEDESPEDLAVRDLNG